MWKFLLSKNSKKRVGDFFILAKSQAEIIRDHINFKFDQNFDYSTKEARSQDVKEMQNQYKKNLTTNYTKLKAHHGKILKEILQKRKIDPRTMGLSKKIPTFVPPKSLDAKITPKPQPVPTATETQSRTPLGYQPTAQPPFAPQVQTPEPFIKFTPLGVAATFNAGYLGLKAFFPYAKDMSPAQQQSLGEMWTPIFNKYLPEKWEIVLAIIATIGIFGGLIAEGRREHDKIHPKEKTKIETPEPKQKTKVEAPQEKAPQEKTPVTLTAQEEKDKIESEKISKQDSKDQWEA